MAHLAKGDIRGLLALMIVGVTMYVIGFDHDVTAEALASLTGISGAIVGYYFAKNGDAPQYMQYIKRADGGSTKELKGE